SRADLTPFPAVENGSHLIKCLVYIDLNMVRAGVVQHPSEWPFSGYNEIHNLDFRTFMPHWIVNL
ncbi:MAG: hypothetical protein KAQ81_06395, partial [Deltaproteobacteria bacterium]|nr:hypothetical protein [Deltaproteobacteria bacterium]